MRTIAVVCENGSTCKSVIANELYESYVRQGVRASLYSLDGQYKDASSAKKADDAEGGCGGYAGRAHGQSAGHCFWRGCGDHSRLADAERHRAVHADGLHLVEEHEDTCAHRCERIQSLPHVRVVHGVAGGEARYGGDAR